MRKEYVKPMMQSEEFVANEYVAACWSISCNVPEGTGYYEKNGQPGYQSGKKGDQKIASGKGCNAVHVASGLDAEEPKANAMWQEKNGKCYKVFYFKAKVHGKDTLSDHFCTMESVNWNPNPNASN